MKSPKRKGDQGEREFIKLVGGYRTYWQPNETHPEDVVVPYLGKGQIKLRRDFKTLYRWLEGVDFIALRGNNKGWLVVLRLETIQKLINH
ncbi:MAG: hypothetical protein ACPLYF_03920 [Fervidobacterium sp.]